MIQSHYMEIKIFENFICNNFDDYALKQRRKKTEFKISEN